MLLFRDNHFGDRRHCLARRRFAPGRFGATYGALTSQIANIARRSLRRACRQGLIAERNKLPRSASYSLSSFCVKALCPSRRGLNQTVCINSLAANQDTKMRELEIY